MNPKRTLLFSLLLAVMLLALVVGLALAQEGAPGPAAPDAEPQPLDALAPEAPLAISSYIPLQGYLTDDSGSPLNGSYQVTLRLYDVSSGGSPLCTSTHYMTLSDGLFNTYINGYGCSIDGRMLYLGISIGSDAEMTPRLRIDNVPYAWTLRPGAVISASIASSAMLHIENWGTGGRGLRSYAMATSGANYGMVGASRSPGGYGGYFYNNGGGVGLFGQTSSASGVGVRAQGVDSGADVILGGNANTGVGDDGILTSDPAYASSDLIFKSNDTVRVDLDNDNGGEDADFEIYNGANTLIFDVDDSGAVVYGGPGVAAFPRPAYDSGWVTVSAGSTQALTHGLGGSSVDNYVVELTCKHPSYGVHIFGLGGDVTSGAFFGVFWRNLTTSTVTVERATDDGECPQVRVRIWMYP